MISAAMHETLEKVQSSLMPAIEQLGVSSSTTASSSSSTIGLDFLHVKNTVMLSYLIDWIVQLRDQTTTCAHGSNQVESTSKNTDSDTDDETGDRRNLAVTSSRRLLEIKTVLDKSRGLDKKLRYQIDKLLAAASSSAVFVTGGIENGNSGSDFANSDDATEPNNDRDFLSSAPEDPLKFRPDPQSFLENDGDKFDAEDTGGSADNDNPEDSGSDRGADGEYDDEDDDLAAAREALALSSQTSKEKQSSKSVRKNKADQQDRPQADFDEKKCSTDEVEYQREVYRAPRLAAVPYTLDVQDRQAEKDKRKRRRLRASELAKTLQAQYGDTPDQEDIHGGGNSDLYGKQRAASKKLAQLEADQIEYEESAMIRLMTSRKQKKEKKRVQRMMESGGDLNQISNLGNLVEETVEYGRSSYKEDDQDLQQFHHAKALEEFHKDQGSSVTTLAGSSGKRHSNGKRRRHLEEEGHVQIKKGKRPKPKNSLQASLYGK
jgi:hypothetical protein